MADTDKAIPNRGAHAHNFARDVPEAVNRLRSADKLVPPPVIVLGEPRAGFLGRSRVRP